MARAFLASTIAELHRRRVFRVATMYAVVAFVVLQLGEITFDPLQLPPWSLTALIIVVLLGFPVVMALAWVFDWTSDGIQRTESDENTSRSRPLLLLITVLGLDALVGYYLYTFYRPSIMEPQTIASAPAPVGADESTYSYTSGNQAPPPENSIAVLPFIDLSPEGDQGYFADGVTEELRDALARIDEMKVAASSSSFAFRGKTYDAREVGRRLNVATILEGTVRKQGDSVRIRAELIDTASGFEIWSDRYDRTVEDIFQIQEDIASAIAEELIGSYEGFAAVEQATASPASFEAYDSYLRGREEWRKRTPESLQRAIEIFKETLELDNTYALAYAGLADAYLLLSNYGNLSTAEAIRQAVPLVEAAVELDPQMSEGAASLGLLYMNLGKLSAAEAHLRRAIDLNPDNTIAHTWLAIAVGEQGRRAEEAAILREALTRDPLNLLLNVNLASNELSRGMPDEGFERLEEVREIYPSSTVVLRLLANWEAVYGRMPAAVDHASLALTLAPDEPPTQAMMAGLLLDIGAMDRAKAIIDDALVLNQDNISVVASYARYLHMTNRHDELRRVAEGLLERSGDAVAGKEAMMPPFWLGQLAASDGRHAEALEYFDRVLEDPSALPPTFAIEVLTWKAYAHRGNDEESAAAQLVEQAQQQMTTLEVQGVTHPGMSYLAAVIATLKGDIASAIDHLRDMAERGRLDVWGTEHDVRLASLRPDPAFKALLDTARSENEMLLAQVESQLLAAL